MPIWISLLVRIAILLALILLAAGVAGGFAVGQLVSIENLRAQVIDQAEASSGRTVASLGRMDIDLLPRPTFSFGKTRLMEEGADGAPVLDVDRIDLTVAPLALLRGEVEVTGVRLVRPRLRLARPTTEPDGLLQLFALLPANDLPRGLAQMSLIDGTIAFEGDDRPRVRRVDLDLMADTDRGPFTAAGSFVHAGRSLALDARLGRFTADPNTTLGFTLETTSDAALPMRLGFQGIVALDQPSSFQGEVEFGGTSLDAGLKTLGASLIAGDPVAFAWPFEFSGVIESEDGEGAITGLDARLGTVAGSGRMGFVLGEPPRIDLALTIPRADLSLEGSSLTTLQRLAGLTTLLEGEVDLVLETLTHNDGIVRDLRLILEMQPEREVVVQTARAVLPGDTDVAFTGRMSGDDGLALAGRLSAVTDRFGEVVQWLAPGIPSETVARFRIFSMEADVALGPDRIDLQALDGRLDVSRVTGDVAFAPGERPTIEADLEVDRLSLDRYVPAGGVDGLLAHAGGAVRASDLALDLHFERVTTSGLRLSDVHLAGRAEAGRLEIDELKIGLPADSGLRLSGVADLEGEDADVEFELTSVNPGPFVRRFGASPAFSLERLGGLAVQGTLAGWTDAATVDARTNLGQIQSTASGRMAFDEDGAVTLALDVDLVHPEYASLLADLGLGGQEMGEEPLAGAFKIRRQPAGGTEVVGHFRLGETRVTGQAGYEPGQPRARLVGRLSVAEPRLETLLPLLAVGGYRPDSLALLQPRPGAWPALYLDPQPLRALDGELEISGTSSVTGAGFDGVLASENGVLRLERGTLRFVEGVGEVAIEGSLDLREAAPALAVAVEASEVALERLPAGLSPSSTGYLNLYGELSATGLSLADMIRSTEGALALSIQDGEIALPVAAEGARPAFETLPLDLLEAQFDVARGLASVKRLDLETPERFLRGEGLIDLLIWMVDLDLVEQDSGRRIDLVGPPGDVAVRLRDLEARMPAE